MYLIVWCKEECGDCVSNDFSPDSLINITILSAIFASHYVLQKQNLSKTNCHMGHVSHLTIDFIKYYLVQG